MNPKTSRGGVHHQHLFAVKGWFLFFRICITGLSWTQKIKKSSKWNLPLTMIAHRNSSHCELILRHTVSSVLTRSSLLAALLLSLELCKYKCHRLHNSNLAATANPILILLCLVRIPNHLLKGWLWFCHCSSSRSHPIYYVCWPFSCHREYCALPYSLGLLSDFLIGQTSKRGILCFSRPDLLLCKVSIFMAYTIWETLFFFTTSRLRQLLLSTLLKYYPTHYPIHVYFIFYTRLWPFWI